MIFAALFILASAQSPTDYDSDSSEDVLSTISRIRASKINFHKFDIEMVIFY
jgi:hypothetical protein